MLQGERHKQCCESRDYQWCLLQLLLQGFPALQLLSDFDVLLGVIWWILLVQCPLISKQTCRTSMKGLGDSKRKANQGFLAYQ